jgi:hypothetical protein
MSDRNAPDFALLLGPYIEAVPATAFAGFLAGLERTAAARYRGWAEMDESWRSELLACAAREDEIAEKIDRLFPVAAADLAAVRATLPAARDEYYAVFADLELREQLRIQADAERQGAAAWRGLATQQTDAAIHRELESCALLEEESADCLERLLREDPAP